jgi:hypothetical protein
MHVIITYWAANLKKKLLQLLFYPFYNTLNL